MVGDTALTAGPDGVVSRIATHHRPLAGLHTLSAELGDLLAGAVDRDHFYAPPRA
ncbi:hypothetical protein ACH3Y9_06035 [Streptomyces sp. WSLK1-5]|uniref:hypothetical protein n=1 Tax=unclassified Streptomyces TaxID=2593676 RepID=UPI003791D00C